MAKKKKVEEEKIVEEPKEKDVSLQKPLMGVENTEGPVK